MLYGPALKQPGNVRAQVVVDVVRQQLGHVHQVARLQPRLDREERIAGLLQKSGDVERRVGGHDLAEADRGIGQGLVWACSAPQDGQNRAPAATCAPHLGHAWTWTAAAAAVAMIPAATPLPAMTAGALPPPPLAAPSPKPSLA